MPRPSSGKDLTRRALSVGTSLVISATRAPAFGDGVHAVAKRGQMTGGPGASLIQKNLMPGIGVSEGIRACDGYAPERLVGMPTAQSEDEARA